MIEIICVKTWGVGGGGEMNQALYAHMNNKRKMKKKNLGSAWYEGEENQSFY
jgi:hypothetical protein